MKCSVVLCVVLCVAGCWTTAGLAQTGTDLDALLKKVTILTCIEPPYQMQEQGQPLTGVSVELVRLVLQEAGVDLEIQVYPWARAYNMAQKIENVMIFSILRNPPREKLFKWVGTLHPFQVFLYRLKDRPDIVVTALADAKKYTIGVLPEDSRNIYLRSQGFGENLSEVQFDSQNILKLFGRRIDLLPSDPVVLAYWFNMVNHDPMFRQPFDMAQVEPIFHVAGADGDNYIAMSPQTDDRVVEHFRQALERVKARAQYQQVLDKYLK